MGGEYFEKNSQRVLCVYDSNDFIGGGLWVFHQSGPGK